MYRWSRRGFNGLAGDYYSLLAQADLQNCDPRDSECVSNNVAKQAAVEDLWVNKYMTLPGGVPDNVDLNFTPQTAAQVKEFYDPANLFWGGNTVDTRGIMTVSTGEAPAVVYNPPPPPVAPAPVVPVVPKAGTTPAGKTIINSSGAQNDTAVTLPFQLPTIGGFSFDSIPWWGWLAGAGAALYVMKGHGR